MEFEMNLQAILIDSREPEWVRNLSFQDLPRSVTMLETGDIWAVAEDGHTLQIERKTPDDLLNTLREERLFPQMAQLAQQRLDQLAMGDVPTFWPYLLISGNIAPGPNGKAVTDRGITGWSYAAVQGALLSIQEMGVFVTQCAGDFDLEAAVFRLGNRSRESVQKILPPRPPQLLGPAHSLIASLPGIGPERAVEVLNWAAHIPAHALAGLVDLDIDAPVPMATRRRIRQLMGLKDNQRLDLWLSDDGAEALKVLEQKG